MAKRKRPQGTAVIFLETDLERVQSFDENNLTPLQKQCFYRLSSVEQEKIREGYGTIVADLESKSTICDFNMESYHPPESALKSLAHALLPSIQEYFSVEENRRTYEEHMKKQKDEK